VAADRALAEDHQAARQDVGALDGDRDGDALPGPAKVVPGAKNDAFAAVHVHRVPDQLAGHFGGVVLGDRGRHRGLFAQIDRGRRHPGQRRCGIGVAGDARQRRLDAFEAADGHVELLADAGVGAGREGAHLGPAGLVEGREMARPTDRHSTSMRQPWPAISTPPISASSGTNTSLPRTGPFWNGRFSGMCRRPSSTPLVPLRHQRQADAQVGSLSPSRPSGSYMRKAMPTRVATGASVM
jgi:hypothetical protein